ncbi:MAG: hypothetical protein EB053_02885 [Chlamydiae bacterium]|nr:hypothetical protein [Chlamydiota bacterium]
MTPVNDVSNTYSKPLTPGGLGAGTKVNSVIKKSHSSAFKPYCVRCHTITGSALKALTQLGLENREGNATNGLNGDITHQKIERAAQRAPFWKNQGALLIRNGDPRGHVLLEYVKRLSNFYRLYRSSTES